MPLLDAFFPFKSGVVGAFAAFTGGNELEFVDFIFGSKIKRLERFLPQLACGFCP